MIRDPYQQYRAMAVETASPVQLVAMLYQGVIRFTLRGIQGIEQGDVARAHDGLTRAQAIIIELAAHLDMKAGGEIAQNLNALYMYSNQRLVEANCQKTAEPAAEVVRLFRQLLPAWQSLAEGRREELAVAGAAVGVGGAS